MYGVDGERYPAMMVNLLGNDNFDGDVLEWAHPPHQPSDGLVCQVTHKSGKTSAMVKARMMKSLVVMLNTVSDFSSP